MSAYFAPFIELDKVEKDCTIVLIYIYHHIVGLDSYYYIIVSPHAALFSDT